MSELAFGGPDTTTMPFAANPMLHDPASDDADIAAFPPRLERMGAQLKQVSAQIEESIVGVCISFQGIGERARSSSARATSFLSKGDETTGERSSFESLIDSCAQTMVKLMDNSTQAGEVALRTVERVVQMDQAAREITDALQKLEEIAMSNRILALNARIEAARSVDQSAGFAAVAVELASQTDKSQKVTSQVSELVGQLRTLAESTQVEQQRMQREGERRVKQCREDVKQTLEALQSAHAQMKEMLNVMSEEGALLYKDIGAAVRGLQFQDRISQRIAHVVEDIHVIQQRLAQRFGDLDGGVGAGNTAFAGYVMREERELYGVAGEESDPGDVELF